MMAETTLQQQCEACGRPFDGRFCDECSARIIEQAAAIHGMKGGRATSEAKRKAAAKNAILAGQANTRERSSKAQKRARLVNMAKAREARMLTLTQIQERAIDKLLSIREPGPRGSGQVQARMRAGARKAYARSARRLGYDAAQIADQWKQVNEMVELRKAAIGDEE